MLPEASLTPTMLSICGEARERRRFDVHAGAALHAVDDDRQRHGGGDGLVVLVEAFLRGLVVIGRDGENAVDAEAFELARQLDDFARVVAAGAGQHGTSCPAASSTVISTTRRCSARVSVGLSPVVPQGTRKSMPASIWRRTRSRSVASSSDRSRRNGVTSAVPHPVNMCTSWDQNEHFVHTSDLAEFVKAFFARRSIVRLSARRGRSLRGCARCGAA